MLAWMMLDSTATTGTPITPATRFPLGALATALLTEPDCYPALITALDTLPAWVPLIALAPAHLTRPLTTLLTPLDQARAAQSIVVAHPIHALPSADTLRDLVNDRPPVPLHTMARWLARRLDRPAHLLEDLLAACLAPTTAQGTPSRSTLNHRVHDLLFCRPFDLVRLHDLAVLPRLADNTGQLADDAGTTATRLAQRVRRALLFTLGNYNARPGWEWPLEAACRRGLGQPDREWGVGSGEWGVGQKIARRADAGEAPSRE